MAAEQDLIIENIRLADKSVASGPNEQMDYSVLLRKILIGSEYYTKIQKTSFLNTKSTYGIKKPLSQNLVHLKQQIKEDIRHLNTHHGFRDFASSIKGEKISKEVMNTIEEFFREESDKISFIDYGHMAHINKIRDMHIKKNIISDLTKFWNRSSALRSGTVSYLKAIS